jgi:hypothetical protein
VSLSRQIDQWSQFLEAMQSGSPSIASTADQMAEDMPSELVDGVKPTTRGTGVLLSGSPPLPIRRDEGPQLVGLMF